MNVRSCLGAIAATNLPFVSRQQHCRQPKRSELTYRLLKVHEIAFTLAVDNSTELSTYPFIPN
jgi:hypothetical protein